LTQGLAAKDVRVHVKNGLAGVATGVQDDAVTILDEAKALGHFRDPDHEFPDVGNRMCLEIMKACGPAFRDDKHVDFRLGLDVLEGQDVVILVNDSGRNLAGQDLVKNGLTFPHSYRPCDPS
jgi:acetyl-CoA carboxylase alpha subunit